MVHVRDDVGDAHDVAFERERARLRPRSQQLALLALRVLEDSVTHLDRQIESSAIILQLLDDANGLTVVIEPALHQFVERGFAGVAER